MDLCDVSHELVFSLMLPFQRYTLGSEVRLLLQKEYCSMQNNFASLSMFLAVEVTSNYFSK